MINWLTESLSRRLVDWLNESLNERKTALLIAYVTSLLNDWRLTIDKATE